MLKLSRYYRILVVCCTTVLVACYSSRYWVLNSLVIEIFDRDVSGCQLIYLTPALVVLTSYSG